MFTAFVQPTLFVEHPIVDFTKVSTQDFDITAKTCNTPPDFMENDHFSQAAYCDRLLTKICELNKFQLKPFIQYQCQSLQEPIIWLNKLEELIDLNSDLYTCKDDIIKMNKARYIIEVLRDHFEEKNKPELNSNSKEYNFPKVKEHLKNFNTDDDKICYLLEQKTDYLQNKPTLTNTAENSFDKRIDLELKLIADLASIRAKKLQAISKDPDEIKHFAKAKINCNVNQFVDIFYQMMAEKEIDGKSILESESNTIVAIITHYFTDKNGHEISEETVRTILKPSRFEKRPKGKNRFQI